MKRRPILAGLVLILLGLWFLLRELGVFPIIAWWPLILLLLGAAAWARYLWAGDRRDPDSVFWGVALLLIGGFFLLRENGWYRPAQLDWDVIWPIFPAIVGASAGLQWLLHLHKWDALLASFAGWIVAAVGFAYTFGYISGDVALTIARFWPLLLILAGIGLVLQYALESRQHPS